MKVDQILCGSGYRVTHW